MVDAPLSCEFSIVRFRSHKLKPISHSLRRCMQVDLLSTVFRAALPSLKRWVGTNVFPCVSHGYMAGIPSNLIQISRMSRNIGTRTPIAPACTPIQRRARGQSSRPNLWIRTRVSKKKHIAPLSRAESKYHQVSLHVTMTITSFFQ